MDYINEKHFPKNPGIIQMHHYSLNSTFFSLNATYSNAQTNTDFFCDDAYCRVKLDVSRLSWIRVSLPGARPRGHEAATQKEKYTK